MHSFRRKWNMIPIAINSFVIVKFRNISGISGIELAPILCSTAASMFMNTVINRWVPVLLDFYIVFFEKPLMISDNPEIF